MADYRQLAGALTNSDTIQATPRNPVLGGVADLLGMAYKLPEMPRMGVPGIDFLAANRKKVLDLLGMGDIQKTADALSYGNAIGTGKGMTYRPKDETINAALAIAPFVGKAIRATEGLPVGANIKLIDDNPLMSIPSGLTRAEQANLIQSQAENFAAKAKEMGLSASVEHSGSKAGPSSYVSISDPITGKKFESPFRFSGHSKGPTQNQFVYDVGNDFSKELNLLENMASSIPKAERDAIQSARQAKMLEELALAEKERLFSQGRPAVQQAMQEANLQQAPYTKAFSNSGNYLGGLLARNKE